MVVGRRDGGDGDRSSGGGNVGGDREHVPSGRDLAAVQDRHPQGHRRNVVVGVRGGDPVLLGEQVIGLICCAPAPSLGFCTSVLLPYTVVDCWKMGGGRGVSSSVLFFPNQDWFGSGGQEETTQKMSKF